ncbi:MAG: hypothetical protein AAF654_05020 [Myxococcota bacterium]
MTCSILIGLVLLSQPVDEFDEFEQPRTVAILPLESDAPEAALAEAWLTRLLIDSKRYRVMPPWEVRERLSTIDADSAAKTLGVEHVLALRKRSARSIELRWITPAAKSSKTRIAKLTSVLPDRDLSMALERLEVVRPVYRVNAPFSVRGSGAKGLSRNYSRVVSFLQDQGRDPTEKLALVEAVLVAFSGLEDPRIDDLQMARSKLLSGRAFLNPVTDEVCRERSDCERKGLCSGGPVACVARAERDCLRSEVCKVDGLCVPVAGECQAAGASCEQSYACVAEGRCEPRAGRCTVPDSSACKESSQCTEVQACEFRYGICTRKDPSKPAVASP